MTGTAPGVRTLVVGIGAADRGDDAAGLLVARLVRDAVPTGVAVVERQGDLTGLVDDLEGVDRAVIVDAVQSGAVPGTVHRLDDVPGSVARAGVRGTHDVDLGTALALADALGRRPSRVVVLGVEGEDFSAGAPVSAATAAGVATAAAMVLAETMTVDARGASGGSP